MSNVVSESSRRASSRARVTIQSQVKKRNRCRFLLPSLVLRRDRLFTHEIASPKKQLAMTPRLSSFKPQTLNIKLKFSILNKFKIPEFDGKRPRENGKRCRNAARSVHKTQALPAPRCTVCPFFYLPCYHRDLTLVFSSFFRMIMILNLHPEGGKRGTGQSSRPSAQRSADQGLHN
jgi:hypothetical protein